MFYLPIQMECKKELLVREMRIIQDPKLFFSNLLGSFWSKYQNWFIIFPQEPQDDLESNFI